VTAGQASCATAMCRNCDVMAMAPQDLWRLVAVSGFGYLGRGT
jgi:hypothetical protein